MHWQECGGGAPIIINNNNVDNSMQSSQTTAVSIPAPTRTNESTVRALQMSGLVRTYSAPTSFN